MIPSSFVAIKLNHVFSSTSSCSEFFVPFVNTFDQVNRKKKTMSNQEAKFLSPLKSPNLSASQSSGAGASPGPTLPPPAPKGASDLVTRASFSLLMAYSFLALVSKGAELVLPIILIIMCMMFREVVRINQKERKDRHMPYFRFLHWWFLFVTVAAITAHVIRDAICASFPAAVQYYHGFGIVVFALYMVGLVAFVLSLKKGLYRYQFHQFTWMAMTLLFIVVQGSLQATNMMSGMIWFLLPVSCVVHNDIWAYGFGKSFGVTKLLRLSPKKTLEGFVGAWFFTMIWGFWFAGFLSKFPRLTCPKVDFHSPMECELIPLFTFEVIQLPQFVNTVTLGHWSSIAVCPVQYHALVLAAFASLVAPFGGFFASGLKRAFKLKDFGDLIPGHGGMTDRMDCQIIMGIFTYVYLHSVVFATASCPGAADISDCIQLLPMIQQRALAKEILARVGV